MTPEELEERLARLEVVQDRIERSSERFEDQINDYKRAVRENDEVVRAALTIQEMKVEEIISIRNMIVGDGSKGNKGIYGILDELREEVIKLKEYTKSIQENISHRKWLWENIRGFFSGWRAVITFIVSMSAIFSGKIWEGVKLLWDKIQN